ncbi:MAG: response regulator [bacterium]
MGLFSKRPSACDMEKILVVDDESSIRRLFNMVLSEAFTKMTIDQACNGVEALRLFRDGRHGVIIMDLRMPVMDGLQAFQAIESFCLKEKQEMPAVIFCTGFAPPEALKQIVCEGRPHTLLQKPVNSQDIIRAVKVGLHIDDAIALPGSP